MRWGLIVGFVLGGALASEAAYAAPYPAPLIAFRDGRPEETKYIQVALVADGPQVTASGGSEATALKMDQIVIHANQILQGSGLSPRLRVVVSGHHLLDDIRFSSTAADGTAADVALLNAFSDWAQGGVAEDTDVAVLITGESLFSTELGLTNLGAACWPGYNYAAIVGGDFSVEKSAEVFVHELGHLVGMGHDGLDNDCPSEGALMRAVGTETVLTSPRFSSCSQAEFTTFLENSYFSRCVRDLPKAVGRDLCGDGFRSGGEACDCGESETCAAIDPCCDARTCQLVDGATCSAFNDESTCCTDKCQSAPLNTECRSARDACDLAETCTGFSTSCPPDSWGSVLGTSCTDDSGFDGVCYQGRCNSGDEQCRMLGGESRKQYSAPPDECKKPDRECRYIECLDVATGNCRNVGRLAADGTPCSIGLCQDGVCESPETVDECPDSAKSRAGTCGCDEPDDDVDGDGYLGCMDGCPGDPNKVQPGGCGCGVPEISDCSSVEENIEESAVGGSSSKPAKDAHAGGSGSISTPDDELQSGSPGGGCGCSTGGQPKSPTMLVLMGILLFRRRRRACGDPSFLS